MTKKAQKIRLGIFIMVSGAFLLLIFGWFTGRGLFEQKDTYYVAYKDISVTGLEVGSPVKYLGINVGSVRDIRIDPRDFSTIIFELTIDPETPVKEDAVADIIAVGITGMKAIEIRGGTEEAGFLRPEGFIEAGSTIAADISGRAEILAFKLEEIMNNLVGFTQPENLMNFTRAAENISILADNSSTTAMNVNEMIAENRDDIRATADALSKISGRLDGASVDFASSMERFNEIMQGEDISEVLGNIREVSLSLREADLQELISNLAETTRYTQNLLANLEVDFVASSAHLSENLILLQYTLENLNDAARKISTDPSVLIRGQSNRNVPDRNLQGN
jgi:phospholipid/cholesterol/gamma-HCH transport system substrate-binding protein